MDQDETYDREQKKFKRWVDAQIELGLLKLDDDGCYLTTVNVEAYFHEVVVLRMLNANSVGRVVSALQKMANEREYAGSRMPFVVKTHMVEQAIKLQQERYLAYCNAVHMTTNPLG